MDEYKGKKVVVLGLARSGVAVSKCLHQLGARVIASDMKKECKEADVLKEWGIPVVCGAHPLDMIDEDTALVIKNPGIPYHIQAIQKALHYRIPVVTEVEIAGRISKAPIIGITGTNGKTTTTELVGDMLRLNAIVGGNIGTPLTEVVSKAKENQWVVAELSSFQLKGTVNFRPKIAALLNIEEAHLDYHRTFSDYANSKKKLFSNQYEEDIAILNYDSPVSLEYSQLIRAKIFWFSCIKEVDSGVYIKNEKLYCKHEGIEQLILPVKDIALFGAFNLENVLCATQIALSCRCPISEIQRSLTTFTGVAHRLEFVRSLNGVRYFNDSKATNMNAARKALSSFNDPVIWIAGGLNRGVDFKSLLPVMKDTVKMVVAIGETKEIMRERAMDAHIPFKMCHDLEEAVYLSQKHADFGDVVLLSPGCASWDMYTSFEERGGIFKQAVHSL